MRRPERGRYLARRTRENGFLFDLRITSTHPVRRNMLWLKRENCPSTPLRPFAFIPRRNEFEQDSRFPQSPYPHQPSAIRCASIPFPPPASSGP
jgi:hypothetical protein